MTKITRAEARTRGCTVDDSCYPPLAYKGPRFSPTQRLDTYTRLETELMAALGAIKARIDGRWNDPDLVAFGPLSPDLEQDVMTLAHRALENK